MEMKQTLKTHFELNLSAYKKFYIIRASKWPFWLRSYSGKVVLILHEYLNIYYIIISLRNSFGAPRSSKNTFHVKTTLL